MTTSTNKIDSTIIQFDRILTKALCGIGDVYSFLGQTTCSAEMSACSGDPESPCPEDELDRGEGNVFIGSGFSDPRTRAWIDNIYFAHWKNQ